LFLNSINFVVSDKQRRVRRASLTDFGFAEEEMKELDSDSDRSTEPIREAEREKKKCQDEEERQRSAKKEEEKRVRKERMEKEIREIMAK